MIQLKELSVSVTDSKTSEWIEFNHLQPKNKFALYLFILSIIDSVRRKDDCYELELAGRGVGKQLGARH